MDSIKAVAKDYPVAFSRNLFFNSSSTSMTQMKCLPFILLLILCPFSHSTVPSLNTNERANPPSSSSLSFIPVSFAPPLDISYGSVAGLSALDAGDINQDGMGDVVAIDGGIHSNQKTFAWFQAPQSLDAHWIRHELNPDAPLNPFVGATRLTDIDQDGDLDLVVSSDLHSGQSQNANILVFINPRPKHSASSHWNFIYVAQNLPLHHINDMELADMDQDGKIDIIVRSLIPNEIHIFFQNALQSWTQKSIPTNLSESEGLALGLVNNDDFPDISFSGHLLLAPPEPRNSNYTHIPIDPTYATINQNTKEAFGDINQDGYLDLLIAPAEFYRGGKNHQLAWYQHPGDDLSKAWQKHVVLENTNNTHTVKLAHINNDAHIDIVTGIPWEPKSIQIFYNRGDGTFSKPQFVSTTMGLYSGRTIDIDDDGDVDIIGQESYSSDSKPYLYRSLLKDSE